MKSLALKICKYNLFCTGNKGIINEGIECTSKLVSIKIVCFGKSVVLLQHLDSRWATMLQHPSYHRLDLDIVLFLGDSRCSWWKLSVITFMESMHSATSASVIWSIYIQVKIESNSLEAISALDFLTWSSNSCRKSSAAWSLLTPFSSSQTFSATIQCHRHSQCYGSAFPPYSAPWITPSRRMKK